MADIHVYYHKACHRQQVLYQLQEAEALNAELLLTHNQPLTTPFFALDIWPGCELIPINSINAAVQALKARKLRWYHYPLHSVRRGELIAQALAKPARAPFDFPMLDDNRYNFGIFTLMNDHELLVCKQPWKRVPLGHYEFTEDKTNPPNRAYLKLWEAFSFIGVCPQPGEVCLDLGAAPGGWSWVLGTLGAKVIAVDKAPLAPSVLKLSQLEYLCESAFALNPHQFGTIDWVCADIICYPRRLLNLINRWLSTGKVKRMCCTIKLQGQEDWDCLFALKALPYSTILHLYQNKHELSFFYFHPELYPSSINTVITISRPI